MNIFSWQSVYPSVMMCVFGALSWRDTIACNKSVPLCWSTVRQVSDINQTITVTLFFQCIMNDKFHINVVFLVCRIYILKYIYFPMLALKDKILKKLSYNLLAWYSWRALTRNFEKYGKHCKAMRPVYWIVVYTVGQHWSHDSGHSQ